ncbi:drug/metabolite transporter permease [Klebsiella pneumoniae]|uniref:Drug/metabolite transporter permease n=1 Tax=Klebsiella pneumoniae TaxID=573 RepID=A0A4P0Y3Z4_KLEPN|nr:drug/metabolite transporter permease [Klebsiella pneumoniae]
MRVIDYGRLLLLAALWGASFLFMRITTPAFGGVEQRFSSRTVRRYRARAVTRRAG